MTLGEKIKQARVKSGLTQTELGVLVFKSVSGGAAQMKIKRMESDEQEPKFTELLAIARALNVDLSEFVKLDNVEMAELPKLRPQPIPVISWVQAGAFAEAIDLWPVGVSGEGDPVFTDKKVSPNAFGLRVMGDSMEPRYIKGDVIIIDPSIKCECGDKCVVSLNGETTFKIFKEFEDEIRLIPLNPKYPHRVIPKNSKVDFRVIGKVVDMKPQI